MGGAWGGGRGVGHGVGPEDVRGWRGQERNVGGQEGGGEERGRGGGRRALQGKRRGEGGFAGEEEGLRTHQKLSSLLLEWVRVCCYPASFDPASYLLNNPQLKHVVGSASLVPLSSPLRDRLFLRLSGLCHLGMPSQPPLPMDVQLTQ